MRPPRVHSTHYYPLWRRAMAQWHPHPQEDWEERAGIMEYCGGLPRLQAEKAAFDLVASKLGALCFCESCKAERQA